MAKRKAHKKPVQRRRRRMGATSSGIDFTQVLLAIGGGVAARVLVNKLPEDIGGVDISKVKPFLPVAVGYFLPQFIKSPMVKPIALGMMVGGGVNVLQGLGVIGALGGDEAPMIAAIERQLAYNGGSAPMIAGYTGKPVMAG